MIVSLLKKCASICGIKKDSYIYAFLRYLYVSINPLTSPETKKLYQLNLIFLRCKIFVKNKKLLSSFIISQDEIWVKSEDGSYLYMNTDPSYELGTGQNIELLQMSETPYYSVIAKLIKSALGHSSSYVDVGANNGYYFSIKISRKLPETKIYAFEPNKKILPLLYRNLEKNNCINVKVVPQAIMSKEGSGVITTDLGACGYVYSNRDKTGNDEIIETTTLDAFFVNPKEHVGVIKIDVEGNEAEVILGGQKLFERDKPVVIFEYNPDVFKRNNLPDRNKEVCEFLVGIGYTILQVEDSHDLIAYNNQSASHDFIENLQKLKCCPFDDKTFYERTT